MARRQPAHLAHRRRQPRIVEPSDDAPDILARSTAHGVPLRPVAHLDQPVVVAEADHGPDREAQHLVGRAGPDAADHRQEVAVAEPGAEAVAVQEVSDRLVELGVGAPRGDRGRQPVEAQDLGQHVPEPRPQQVASLREDARQVGTAPLQSGRRRLDRERHVRRCGRHAELVEQPHQVRVGAMVEDEKSGIDAVRDGAGRSGQRHVDRIRVAAEMPAGLEQRDVGVVAQPVRGGQPGDARTDDRDAASSRRAAGAAVRAHRAGCGLRDHGRASGAAATAAASGSVERRRTVAQRPGTNEGGREEEERRPGISALTGRLRDRKTIEVPRPRTLTDSPARLGGTCKLRLPAWRGVPASCCRMFRRAILAHAAGWPGRRGATREVFILISSKMN